MKMGIYFSSTRLWYSASLLLICIAVLLAFTQAQVSQELLKSQVYPYEIETIVVNADNPASRQLMIERISLSRDENSSLTSMSVTILNTGEQAIHGRNWYVISSRYSDSVSRASKNYEAPYLDFTLAAYQSITMEFEIPDLLLFGIYELSIRVHRRNQESGIWEHADSYQYPEGIYIGNDMIYSLGNPANAAFREGDTITVSYINRGQPVETSPVQIENMSVFYTNNFIYHMRTTLRNTSNHNQSARVWYVITPLNSTNPVADALFQSASISLDFSDGEARTAIFNVATDIPGGYTISVLVDYRDEAGNFVFSDTYVLPDERDDNSLSINDSPVIVSEDNQLIVDFILENTAREKQMVGLMVGLMPQNSPIAIENIYFSTSFIFADIESEDTAVVRLDDFVDVPDGEYQVVAWLYLVGNNQQTLQEIKIIASGLEL